VNFFKTQIRTLICILLLSSGLCLAADTAVNLSATLPSLDIIYNKSVVTIERNQDTENTLRGSYAKTSRPCPPACIVPIMPVDNINIVGEYEVLAFLERQYLSSKGLIIDARSSSAFLRATIPGSINLPHQDYSGSPNAERTKYLTDLINAGQRAEAGKVMRFLEQRGLMGGENKTEKFDFTDAKRVLIWDDGPWSENAHTLINTFTKLGYPAEYIYYYHGGMQSWLSFGLTIVKP